jgi:hypothetical protein
MARNWMEPPAWWVKYKPLRWVLAAVVLYWIFGTLLPRFKEDSPVTAEPIPAEKPVEPVASAPKPAPLPPAPVTPAEIPKPPPAVPITPPKPAPVPAPVAKPLPEKPPVIAATPKPPPKPVPVTPPKPAPVAPPKPVPTPAPVAKAAPPVQAQAKPAPAPAPVLDPMARYTQVESERVSLINGLRSYDGVEAVKALLEKAGYAVGVSVIERPSNSRYPPYRNDTLVVSNYKHAEFEGKLTLEFFNDRLYQTFFEPAKAADYLGRLRARGVALPVKRTGRSTLTIGNLLISTNIDFAVSEVGTVMRAKPFVLWEDTRLTQQMKEWGPVR